MLPEKELEPYKVFFPLGVFSAILGVSLWLLFHYRFINFYPKNAHANIMFIGFFWSFILGFLMTAYPKMTGTFQIQPIELFSHFLLVIIQIVLNIRNMDKAPFIVLGLQIFLLIVFILRRYRTNSKLPFPGFIFIPFALFQGLVGLVSYFYYSLNQSIVYFLSGEVLLANFILGLGSRLIPVIGRCNVKNPSYKIFILFAALLNLGYLLEIFLMSIWGSALKTLVVFLFSVVYLRLFEIPSQMGVVPLTLKFSIAILNIFYILKLFYPTSLAQNHGLYIGFFLLTTLVVATRVTLSHGNQELLYENRSKKLALIFICITLAGLLRVFSLNKIESPLFLASICFFLLGTSIWISKFISVLKRSN
jgi:uncharacterized protein involved in response to NO